MNEQTPSFEMELAVLAEQFKSLSYRLNEQAQLISAVYSLTTDIKVIANEMTGMKTDVSTMKKDVEQLKMKPGDMWKWFVGVVGAAGIGGVIAFLMKYILG